MGLRHLELSPSQLELSSAYPRAPTCPYLRHLKVSSWLRCRIPYIHMVISSCLLDHQVLVLLPSLALLTLFSLLLPQMRPHGSAFATQEPSNWCLSLWLTLNSNVIVSISCFKSFLAPFPCRTKCTFSHIKYKVRPLP